MATKVITCPDTGDIEAIDALAGRDGELLVVLRCTRFEPFENVQCEMHCLQRLNCAARRDTIER